MHGLTPFCLYEGFDEFEAHILQLLLPEIRHLQNALLV
jgi:hypothetical protein